jgi:hypothetical protein
VTSSITSSLEVTRTSPICHPPFTQPTSHQELPIYHPRTTRLGRTKVSYHLESGVLFGVVFSTSQYRDSHLEPTARGGYFWPTLTLYFVIIFDIITLYVILNLYLVHPRHLVHLVLIHFILIQLFLIYYHLLIHPL